MHMCCINIYAIFCLNKTVQLTARPADPKNGAVYTATVGGGGNKIYSWGERSYYALISNCPNVIKRKSLGAGICNFQIGL